MAQTLVAAGLDIQGLDTISKEVHSESFKEASTFQQKDDPVFIANSYKVVAKTE